MNITRRLFLRNTAAASATATVVAVPVAAETTPSARERFAYHLAELKKAASELDPRIARWHVNVVDNDDLNCPIVIAAFRRTGRYEGDGLYERSEENALGGYTKYKVRLLPDRIDGHRTFDVRTSMDRLILTEPAFESFVLRRVS